MRTANDLIGHSLHLLNMWEQFFESYSEDIQKKMPKRDKGNFEMYRNNAKDLMEELKSFLENN